MREIIAKGRDQGMQTFNQALLDLYNQEVITFEEALFASSNPDEFRLNAKGMFTGTDSITIYKTSGTAS